MNLINSLKKVIQIKSLFILSSALVVSLSTVSCKDNDDRYVTPDITISSEVVNNIISFEKTGGEKSFGVSSNRPWKVEVNADWISVSPTSGNEGDTRVIVKTLDNSNGIARESMIKITTGTIVKNITVKQAGSTGFEIVTIIDENFNSGLGCWTSLAVTEGASWRTGEYKNDGYVEVSAHGSGKEKYETMLVSPAIEFKSSTKLSFKYKGHHAVAGTKLHVVLLDDAKKVIGDPFKTIDPSTPQTGYDRQYNDVVVDIPLTENAKYIALYYVGTKEFTTGFQVDNVKLVGGEGSVPVNCNGGDPAPTPTPSGDAVDNFNVNFEGLAQALPQGWTSTALEGKRKWGVKLLNGNNVISMTSYKSKESDKVMLVSPKVSILKDATLSFKMGIFKGVAGTMFKVLLLDENKNKIKELKSYDLNADRDLQIESFDIQADQNVKYIGFLYEGDATKTASINLDDIVLAPKGGVTPTPTPDPQPTPEPTPTPDPTPVAGDVDIFIHAYSEGNGNNKYIVLYNPTDKEVDLSAYKLACDQWGGKTNSNLGVKSAPLSGTIQAKGFKVFSHSAAVSYKNEDGTLKYKGEEPDKSPANAFGFNGDDCMALLKNDDSVIDVFGPYFKKAQKWVDGDKGVAADKTFIRKSSVSKPAKEYNAEEWDIVDMNDFSRFTTR